MKRHTLRITLSRAFAEDFRRSFTLHLMRSTRCSSSSVNLPNPFFVVVFSCEIFSAVGGATVCSSNSSPLTVGWTRAIGERSIVRPARRAGRVLRSSAAAHDIPSVVTDRRELMSRPTTQTACLDVLAASALNSDPDIATVCSAFSRIHSDFTRRLHTDSDWCEAFAAAASSSSTAKRVLIVGLGSGIPALAAAKAGCHVLGRSAYH